MALYQNFKKWPGTPHKQDSVSPNQEEYKKSAKNASDFVKKLRSDQGFMPLGEHLDELRKRIIRIFLWILGFGIVCFFFYKQVWAFIMGPVLPLIAKSKLPGAPVVKIIATKLGEAVQVEMQILFLAGLILALPIVLFELWGFIMPALDKSFRRWGNGILLAALILFWVGVGFSRMYVWPSVIQFLVLDWLPPALDLSPTEKIIPDVYLSISDYFSFFFAFHMAFGISFEMPVICVILASMGILNSAFFIKTWRYAIVIIAIVSAIVVPPDVFSMLALMLPLIVLFAISGLLVYLIERKQRKKP